MLWEQIFVREQERVVVTSNGRFERILLPGEYCIEVPSRVALGCEKHSVEEVVFRSVWTEYLIDERPDLIEQHFTLVRTTETQVAMVYVDEQLFTVLVPAKHFLCWRGQARVTAEIVEVLAEADPLADLFDCVLGTAEQTH